MLIPARLASRRNVASIAYHWRRYVDNGREVTAQNMHCNKILKDFYKKWEALGQMKKQDVPKLTTLSYMNTP